ncbi:hypothetical protein CPB83DRAFT_659165 [Crepidotus variabilis]|uniref:Uncharacterized protein n=1 Tax=Crepidotus variabilis TaxID=179855 RepID=A0A9P6E746_9AGAR|nr:hypothetical protein CPB83DRAFT_659165 [Crepidotus variabilis]
MSSCESQRFPSPSLSPSYLSTSPDFFYPNPVFPRLGGALLFHIWYGELRIENCGWLAVVFGPFLSLPPLFVQPFVRVLRFTCLHNPFSALNRILNPLCALTIDFVTHASRHITNPFIPNGTVTVSLYFSRYSHSLSLCLILSPPPPSSPSPFSFSLPPLPSLRSSSHNHTRCLPHPHPPLPHLHPPPHLPLRIHPHLHLHHHLLPRHPSQHHHHRLSQHHHHHHRRLRQVIHRRRLLVHRTHHRHRLRRVMVEVEGRVVQEEEEEEEERV